MNEIPDNQLDALLRDVAVPVSLAARLREITIPSDDELDQLLGGVAMPEHLTLQLQAIPADEVIADELCDVPEPVTLRSRVRLSTRLEKRQRSRRQFSLLTTAACLFVVVSAALLTSSSGFLSSLYRPFVNQLTLVPTLPSDVIPEPIPELDNSPLISLLNAAALELPPTSEPTLLDNWDEIVGKPAPVTGPIAQFKDALRSGMRPMDDVVLMRWGLLGAPQYSEDNLPELVRMQKPLRSGLELPLVRGGYDRNFWLLESINPPINPAADPKLQQLEVPLTTSTATFDAAAAALALGKLPNRDEVRVEHFLAALESRFPAAPRGQLALHVQGCPSPFGTNDAYLLQLGVQAGKLKPSAKKQPTHLVVAVDVSASMARGGRMEMVRNAVQQALRQLSPKDALSLVAFDEQVVCRVEHLRVNHEGVLRQQLAELFPHGGTNLAAGLQTAASVSLSQPAGDPNDNYRTRLVLITDSRAVMPADISQKISEVLQHIRDEGVRLDVFDVSGRLSPDPLLEGFTNELGGSYRAISSRQQLFAALVASLAGQSPAVAAEAKLKIQFNKDVVAAYRLLGHEPNQLAAITPATVDAQLLPEEAASVMLELWFKKSEASELGQVTLSWKDPVTSAKHERKLPIERSRIAASFSETPASLQTAVVAAEIAEQLRGSRDVLRLHKLLPPQSAKNNITAIRNVIRPWSPTLRQEPDLNRLLMMLDQIERKPVK